MKKMMKQKISSVQWQELKGINYVLSKILCKKQNVLKETMDNISDVYVKENISGHTLSEMSNTRISSRIRKKAAAQRRAQWQKMRVGH